ncbi:MAG: hypothetical protein GY754_20205 [bacterium]|nr:hypothetical protein [bacterium]
MLPIVDYGSIAIVVPQVTAVGSVIDDTDRKGFEVFLSGMDEPLIVGFDNLEEAEESRNELIAIIAQYHYAKELGPDFELGDVLNVFEEGEDDEEMGEEDFDYNDEPEKKEH